MTCFHMGDGQTLSSYCRVNDLPYNMVYRRIEEGMSVEEAVECAKKSRHRKDFNRKYFYKGHYIGDLLGGYESILYRRFLSENRRTKDLVGSLAKYMDITKVVEK